MKIIFNKIEKRGTPSKVNDELIRIDLPFNNHNNSMNKEKR